MLIKTTFIHHFSPNKLAEVQKSENTFCQQNCRDTLLVGMQNGTTPVEENLAAALPKLQMHLLSKPALPYYTYLNKYKMAYIQSCLLKHCLY